MKYTDRATSTCCAVLYITAGKRAKTTQGETVASARDSVWVCVCLVVLSGPLVSVSVSDPQPRGVAVTFQGSWNLAERTKTRQEVKHLGCQLAGSREVLIRGGWGGNTQCLHEGIMVPNRKRGCKKKKKSCT